MDDGLLQPIKLNAEEAEALLERLEAADVAVEALSDEAYAALEAERRAAGERALARVRRGRPKTTAAA